MRSIEIFNAIVKRTVKHRTDCTIFGEHASTSASSFLTSSRLTLRQLCRVEEWDLNTYYLVRGFMNATGKLLIFHGAVRALLEGLG